MNGMSASQINLIVGLGNPGREYEGTRHNVGFQVTAAFMKSLPSVFNRKEKYSSVYWEGRFKGRNLLVQHPLTFMNLSGKAVAALAEARGISPSEIIVAYDDMDLPLGKIRIRKSGSSAGHRGVESLIEYLGTSHFPRLRIGIGRPAAGSIDHVLAEFEDDEKPVLDEILKVSVDALTLSLTRGVGHAMNSFNSISREPEKTTNPGEKPEPC
ncbi:MAG: aminoacyl-tRNA hydrolase [Victivallaceae bacterium]|nr:aminoacyl-tRNA hydrolase [Victivallaceae bacterium]